MAQETEVQRKLLAALKDRDRRLSVAWDDATGVVTHLSGALSEAQGGDPIEIARAFLTQHQALFGIEEAGRDLGRATVKTDPYGWHHVAFQQQVSDVPVWSGVVQVHMSGKGAVRSVSSDYKPRATVDPVPALGPGEAVSLAAKEIGIDEQAKPMREPYLVVYIYEGESHLVWSFSLRGWDVGLGGKTREPASWLCFVDAHDGKLIAHFNQIATHVAPTGEGESVNNPPNLTQTTKTFPVSHTHGPDRYRLQDSTRHIDVYDADGDIPSGWAGAITGNLSEDDNDDWDTTTGWNSADHTQRILCQSAEVDALDYLARVFDYYTAKFGRNSLDGAGMTIRAYAHVRTLDEDGNTIAYNNAYWDPNNEWLVFGDGEYTGIYGAYGDLTFFSGALDVVAHEYAHGVTYFEIQTAGGANYGFIYSGESGATSEAFSDIFAAFIEGDWRQGDKVVVGAPDAAGHMWRDLANPTRGLAYDPTDTINQFLAKGVPQPDHYEIRYQGTGELRRRPHQQQYHHLCLLSGDPRGRQPPPAGRTPEGVRVYRKDRLGIGMEHAEQIFYLALTNYFNGAPGSGDNRDATFREVRQAVLDACDQLRIDNQHGVDQCDWNTLNTAFYAVGLHPVGEHYGPDPMITPWGIWTGDTPHYKSPDVWCEDGGGGHVNAEKATVNDLVAQVHNIGDQAADGVTVRFFYSPCNAGYHHEDFKQIDEVLVDLAAGETRAVHVDWDLTDLTEDFGGLWPQPISDFDHFCVRVEIITNVENDVNTCNNMAQHNFFDVITHQGAVPETAMIIANPDKELQAKVTLEIEKTLPSGWQVLFDGRRVPRAIGLKGGEKRVVKVSVSVPVGPLIQAPIDGFLEGKLGGHTRGLIEGKLDQVVFNLRSRRFQGRVVGAFNGSFRAQAQLDGRILDRETGEFAGKLRGTAADPESGKVLELEGEVSGRLTPKRRVSVGGRINDRAIGGVDLNLIIKR